jgi:hypothetical protein
MPQNGCVFRKRSPRIDVGFADRHVYPTVKRCVFVKKEWIANRNPFLLWTWQGPDSIQTVRRRCLDIASGSYYFIYISINSFNKPFLFFW